MSHRYEDSMLSFPIGGDSMDFIQDALEGKTTKEVQKYVREECDVILECKVCKQLFRSPLNFVQHKRTVCRSTFMAQQLEQQTATAQFLASSSPSGNLLSVSSSSHTSKKPDARSNAFSLFSGKNHGPTPPSFAGTAGLRKINKSKKASQHRKQMTSAALSSYKQLQPLVNRSGVRRAPGTRNRPSVNLTGILSSRSVEVAKESVTPDGQRVTNVERVLPKNYRDTPDTKIVNGMQVVVEESATDEKFDAKKLAKVTVIRPEPPVETKSTMHNMRLRLKVPDSADKPPSATDLSYEDFRIFSSIQLLYEFVPDLNDIRCPLDSDCKEWVFPSIESLVIHLGSFHEKPSFNECLICGKSVKSVSFKEHAQAEHSNVSGPEIATTEAQNASRRSRRKVHAAPRLIAEERQDNGQTQRASVSLAKIFADDLTVRLEQLPQTVFEAKIKEDKEDGEARSRTPSKSRDTSNSRDSVASELMNLESNRASSKSVPSKSPFTAIKASPTKSKSTPGQSASSRSTVRGSKVGSKSRGPTPTPTETKPLPPSPTKTQIQSLATTPKATKGGKPKNNSDGLEKGELERDDDDSAGALRRSGRILKTKNLAGRADSNSRSSTPTPDSSQGMVDSQTSASSIPSNLETPNPVEQEQQHTPVVPDAKTQKILSSGSQKASSTAQQRPKGRSATRSRTNVNRKSPKSLTGVVASRATKDALDPTAATFSPPNPKQDGGRSDSRSAKRKLPPPIPDGPEYATKRLLMSRVARARKTADGKLQTKLPHGGFEEKAAPFVCFPFGQSTASTDDTSVSTASSSPRSTPDVSLQDAVEPRFSAALTPLRPRLTPGGSLAPQASSTLRRVPRILSKKSSERRHSPVVSSAESSIVSSPVRQVPAASLVEPRVIELNTAASLQTLSPSSRRKQQISTHNSSSRPTAPTRDTSHSMNVADAMFTIEQTVVEPRSSGSGSKSRRKLSVPRHVISEQLDSHLVQPNTDIVTALPDGRSSGLTVQTKCLKASYTSQRRLHQYLAAYVDSRNLSCLVCAERLRSPLELRAHCTAHMPRLVYECTPCGYITRYNARIMAHLAKMRDLGEKRHLRAINSSRAVSAMITCRLWLLDDDASTPAPSSTATYGCSEDGQGDQVIMDEDFIYSTIIDHHHPPKRDMDPSHVLVLRELDDRHVVGSTA